MALNIFNTCIHRKDHSYIYNRSYFALFAIHKTQDTNNTLLKIIYAHLLNYTRFYKDFGHILEDVME